MKLKLIPNETKICSVCGKEKPLSQFHKDKLGKQGVRSDCKECRNVRPEDKVDRKSIKNFNDTPRGCTICGKLFTPQSNRQLYCKACQLEARRKKCREYRASTYVKRGRSHLVGKNANGYVDGIGLYPTLAKKQNAKCNRCGSKKFLVVHHKDRNRHNNKRKNLEVLCKSCHQKEHLIHDSLGRFCGSK